MARTTAMLCPSSPPQPLRVGDFLALEREDDLKQLKAFYDLLRLEEETSTSSSSFADDLVGPKQQQQQRQRQHQWPTNDDRKPPAPTPAPERGGIFEINTITTTMAAATTTTTTAEIHDAQASSSRGGCRPVRHDRPKIILLTGRSGTGKTTLAMKFKQFVERPTRKYDDEGKDGKDGDEGENDNQAEEEEDGGGGGIFIMGKYNQNHGSADTRIPFSGFAQAFSDFARQITTEERHTNRLASIRGALRVADEKRRMEEMGGEEEEEVEVGKTVRTTTKMTTMTTTTSPHIDRNLLISTMPALRELYQGDRIDDASVPPTRKNDGGGGDGSVGRTKHGPKQPITHDSIHEDADRDGANSTEEGLAGVTREQRQYFLKNFRHFLRCILGQCGIPLVVFLDDLQWGDAGSLELLHDLALLDLPGFQILGSCRSNEVDFDDPLSRCLRSVEDRGVIVQTVHSRNLPQNVLHEMLSDGLGLPSEQSRSLAELVHDQTDGNFFHMKQYLNSLQADIPGALSYDEGKGRWSYDETAPIKATGEGGGSSRDLVPRSCQELMKRILQDQSPEVRELLMCASTLGSMVDLELVHALMSSSSLLFGGTNVTKTKTATMAVIKEAVEKGFLIKVEKSRYRFAHDQIQQAAYLLVPPSELEAFHFSIYDALFSPGLSRGEVESHLFLGAEQITRCRGRIDRSSSERHRAASFLLLAGTKASASSAFAAAAVYLRLGIDVLGETRWTEKASYPLCLSLHNAAIEMCYCNADKEPLTVLLNAVYANAQTYTDKIPAFCTNMSLLGSSQAPKEAMQLGLSVLSNMNEGLKRLTKLNLMREVVRTKMLLRNKTTDEVLSLPPMTDETKMMVVKIMTLMFIHVLHSDSDYVVILATKLIQLTFQYGINEMSAPAFAIWAAIQCSGKVSFLRDIDRAYWTALLAMQLLKRYKSRGWVPRVMILIHAIVMHRMEPLSNSLERLLESYHIGLEAGDIEGGCISGAIFVVLSARSGTPLSEVMRQIQQFFLPTFEAHQQDLCLHFLKIEQQAIANLMGWSEDPLVLNGEFLSEAEITNLRRSVKAFGYAIDSITCVLALHLGRFDMIESYSKGRGESSEPPIEPYPAMILHFIKGISAIILLRSHRGNDGERRQAQRLRLWKRSHRRIRELALSAPTNYMHLLHLLEAEHEAWRGNHDRSHQQFRRAINLAEREGFQNYAAFAYERLAFLCLCRHWQEEAREHYLQARRAYDAWGAIVKVKQLDSFLNENHASTELLSSPYDGKKKLREGEGA